MTDYISVKIPMVLANNIRSILEKTGFTSVTNFVLYAARQLLREIEDKTKKIINKCRWDEHNYKMKLVCIYCNDSPPQSFSNGSRN